MPHLLLVDDDDLFRESLGLNLIDEGYEVTSFANGRDVLAYLDQGGGADVMLLDWRMPNLTGLDVLRQIRAAGTSIPVIFLTVLSDDIYEEAALESGAVDFIDKSRRLPILLKRLQLIAEGGRPSSEPEPARASTLQLGRLTLRFDISRAVWLSSASEKVASMRRWSLSPVSTRWFLRSQSAASYPVRPQTSMTTCSGSRSWDASAPRNSSRRTCRPAVRRCPVGSARPE